MPDCSMFELEDIAWDIFGDSYDHVVPHDGAQIANNSNSQGDSHKKARHDRQNANERNSGIDGSREKDVIRSIEGAKFPLSCAPDCLDEVTTLASDDTITSESRFIGRNVDTSANELLSGEPTYETNSIADEGELCNFSLDTPEENDISFLENEPKNRKNCDIVDYDWPDVSTIDDVERMLSYSAFGEEGYENVDEVSWLSSSSYIIDGSERNSKSGLPSPSPQISMPRDSSQLGAILWPENDTSILNSSKPSDLEYGCLKHWLETDIQVDVSKEQESVKRNNSKREHQLEHRGKLKISEYVTASSYDVPGLVVQCKDQPCTSSSVSPPHASLVGHQNHFLESDNSSYERAHSIFLKSMHSCDAQKDLILQPITFMRSSKNAASDSSTYIPIQVSCNERQFANNMIDSLSDSPTSVSAKKIEEMHLGKQPPIRLIVSHPTQNQASSSEETSSTKKKLYRLDAQVGGDDALIKGSQLHTGLHIDTCLSKGNSCAAAAALPERMLSSPTTLQQLQNVMDQLDIRTKLCIRDGLYRLARSAEQRHTVESSKFGCRETMESRRYIGDKSKRCHGFMNLEMETGTNPIDRSIAHLLFGGAYERPPSPRVEQ